MSTESLFSISVAYRWAITIGFMALIVGLSITPGIERPHDSLFSWLYQNTSSPVQKVMHVAIYATLAALWMWTLAGIGHLRIRLALSLVLTLGLGIALEWFQTMIPGRYGTIIDVILNAIGTIVGLLIAALML